MSELFKSSPEVPVSKKKKKEMKKDLQFTYIYEYKIYMGIFIYLL